MAKIYEPPSWAGSNDSVESFSLDVLKDGLIINNISLSGKSYFMIGRQPDICDIALEHQSISRQHAVLQFRDDGALFLFDMGSAQGTYVNKKLCLTRVYQRMYVGDIMAFGASTRKYIVCGPESAMPPEYDSENMQQYRLNLARQSNKLETLKKNEESNGISWGFREDAETEEDMTDEPDDKLPEYIVKDKNYDRKYGDKYSSTIIDSEVHEKDQEILEKIRAKERKIQNMQEEIRRIYMKENKQEGILTDGQSAAVKRNDDRIAQLTEEIAILENKIRTNNAHREGSTKSKSSSVLTSAKSSANDNFEEDERALDTTAETQSAATNWRIRKKLMAQKKEQPHSSSSNIALTYEDLLQEKVSVSKEIEHLDGKIAAAEALVLSRVSEEVEEEMDALLAHMNSKQQLEEAAKLRTLRDEKARKLASVQRLLTIATPALASLVKASLPSPSLTSVSVTAPVAAPAPVAAIIAHAAQENKNTRTEALATMTADGGKGNVAVTATDAALHVTATDENNRSSEEEGLHQDDAGRSQQHSTGAECNDTCEIGTKKVFCENDAEEGVEDSTSLNAGQTLVSNVSLSSKGKSEEQNLVSTDKSADTDAIASNKRKRKEGVNRPLKPHDRALEQIRKKVAAAESMSSKKYLEGGELTWLPPTNQSGDGKTYLNSKYGY